MRGLLVGTIAAGAAIATVVATLPPRAAALTPSADGAVRGVLHIHTTRSDGQGSPDQVAAAAARAGLQFIVFTDHGDATRVPDPPTYRSGVLCLDAVEISTSGGHYVALGMPAASFPLGGEPRDVVEDVRRLGGFGIVAHPDSPKRELSWRDWTAPFDGVELLNLDTSWRILASESGWTPRWRLLTGIADYPLRPSPVIAALIQPTRVLDKWVALAQQRRVVVTAGADAHGRVAIRGGDPSSTRLTLPQPGYEDSFQVMSVHVQTDRPLTGRAANDAVSVMRAIRLGHLYTAVEAVAAPSAFVFTATNALGTANEGDEIGMGGPILLHVHSNAPEGFTTVVHEGTRAIAAVQDTKDLTVSGQDGPGVFWVEILSTGRPHPITWIRSNPIYVRNTPPPVLALAQPPVAASASLLSLRIDSEWTTEHDPLSVSGFDIADRFMAADGWAAGSELRFRYHLRSGARSGQYAAVAYSTLAGLGAYRGLAFTIHADRPMRISVQLRVQTEDGRSRRWQRSVYVEPSPREREVLFSDMNPVGAVEDGPPALDRVRSVLFVVDTTNSQAGSSGTVWIRSALQR
jgi:hypothetical protein